VPAKRDHKRTLEPTQASVCHRAKAGIRPQNEYGQSCSAPPVAVADASPRRITGQLELSGSCFQNRKQEPECAAAMWSSMLFSIYWLESRSGGLDECARSRAEAQTPKNVCSDHQRRTNVARRCTGYDNRVSRFGVRTTPEQTIRRDGSKPRDRFVRRRAASGSLHV
jgi:hypothetical protein